MSVTPTNRYLESLTQGNHQTLTRRPTYIKAAQAPYSRLSIKPLVKETVFLAGSYVNSMISSSFVIATVFLTRQLFNAAEKATEHGTSCAEYIGATYLLSDLSLIKKIGWDDRSISDFIPFLNAFKEGNFLDTSLYPPNAVKKIFDTAKNSTALLNYLDNQPDKHITLKTLITDLGAEISSLRAEAACNRYEGHANIAIYAIGSLFGLMILKATYETSKPLLSRIWHKILG